MACRDLATRNVLVGADDCMMVADFGMSRALGRDSEYYNLRSDVKIPIRWSAPEVVMATKYTTASDVWSFFVLMWEVWSRAQTPFGGVATEIVFQKLRRLSDQFAAAAAANASDAIASINMNRGGGVANVVDGGGASVQAADDSDLVARDLLQTPADAAPVL